MKCGNPQCRCRQGDRHLHGPYHYWTTKVKGKSVSRILKPDEATLYLEWIANRRELDRVIKEMLEVSRDAAVAILNRPDTFIPGRPPPPVAPSR